MFRNWKSRKSERGAAALEFAIVLPVLILMLVGIVDFGMVMGAQSQVANAAREGGRAGALTGMQSEAEGAAKAAIAGMPGATNSGTKVVVTCTKTNGSGCNMAGTDSNTGSTVTVTITYVHTWLSPVLLGFLPTFNLQGRSTMRIEA